MASKLAIVMISNSKAIVLEGGNDKKTKFVSELKNRGKDTCIPPFKAKPKLQNCIWHTSHFYRYEQNWLHNAYTKPLSIQINCECATYRFMYLCYVQHLGYFFPNGRFARLQITKAQTKKVIRKKKNTAQTYNVFRLSSPLNILCRTFSNRLLVSSSSFTPDAPSNAPSSISVILLLLRFLFYIHGTEG